MNRRQFLRRGLGVGACVLSGAASGVKAAAPGIERIAIAGPARELGRQHGEMLRDKIRTVLEAWKAYLSAPAGAPAGAVIDDFLRRTRFPEAMAAHTPGLLPEIYGIAEGAGVDPRALLAFNLPDEIRWYGKYKQAGLLASTDDKCTALGATARGGAPPFVAQNMDIASGSEGFEVLLHIKPDNAPEALLFSIAGLAGIIGVNRAGVAVVNNSLPQLDVSTGGLPVNAVVRGILARRTLDEAAAFVQQTPHATGHNYLIGGPDGVRSFECSAHEVTELDDGRFPGVLYHTNHPFANGDVAMSRAFDAKQPPPAGPTSSRARCAAVEAWLEANHEALTPDGAKTILSSRDNAALPVCRPHNPGDPGATYTAACFIAELSRPPVLRLAPGPPSETSFETFRF